MLPVRYNNVLKKETALILIKKKTKDLAKI